MIVADGARIGDGYVAVGEINGAVSVTNVSAPGDGAMVVGLSDALLSRVVAQAGKIKSKITGTQANSLFTSVYSTGIAV
jgi:hypothetical protein